MQTPKAGDYYGGVIGAEMDYWTKWAVALAFSLGFVLSSYGLAGIWAWLEKRERSKR